MFPDGKRVLFVESAARPEVRELRVVLNWFEEPEGACAGEIAGPLVRETVAADSAAPGVGAASGGHRPTMARCPYD